MAKRLLVLAVALAVLAVVQAVAVVWVLAGWPWALAVLTVVELGGAVLAMLWHDHLAAAPVAGAGASNTTVRAAA